MVTTTKSMKSGGRYCVRCVKIKPVLRMTPKGLTCEDCDPLTGSDRLVTQEKPADKAE